MFAKGMLMRQTLPLSLFPCLHYYLFLVAAGLKVIRHQGLGSKLKLGHLRYVHFLHCF